MNEQDQELWEQCVYELDYTDSLNGDFEFGTTENFAVIDRNKFNQFREHLEQVIELYVEKKVETELSRQREEIIKREIISPFVSTPHKRKTAKTKELVSILKTNNDHSNLHQDKHARSKPRKSTC
ncbi:MAG: hypothetical protein [Siphoviridae sp. ctjeG17]|nr:MAG: hypothetical protein [Siphoviridae sp. ctjeG17]